MSSELTLAEAARRTGKSRRTLSRMIEADKITGAHRDDDGVWHVPTDGLLAAGLVLDAPRTPPTDERLTEQTQRAEAAERRLAEAVARADLAERDLAELRRRLEAAETELIDLRRRAEVAEAVARERADTVAALVMVAGAQRELTTDVERGRRWWQRRATDTTSTTGT